MSEEILKKFRTNIPNVPDVSEFEKAKQLQSKKLYDELQFRNQEVIGPVLPQQTYSDETEDEEEEEEQVLDYEPPPYKQFKYQNDNSSSSEGEENDYVNPSFLNKDPALQEIIRTRNSKLALPERTKTRASNIYSNENEENKSRNLNEIELPVSHELVLKGHSRAVTSIAVDTPGARLLSGGYDYQARLWDFAGMDKTMHSFRVIEPFEGQPVMQVSWSKDGKHALCVCGHAQAYLMDREGKRIVETLKGDMYLNDMYKTQGHIATINAGLFHPDSNEHFITCSDDGTVRLFNIYQKLWGICQHLPHKQIVKCTDSHGQRTVPTQLGVHSGVQLCLAGCRDGSIQCFQIKPECLGINKRPQLLFREAHKPNHAISSIKILENGINFITNSTDNTIKLWDIRNPSHFVANQYFSSNFIPSTKMALNKEETLMVTANHYFNKMQEIEQQTELVFYNTKNLEEYARIPAFDVAITDIQWHPILNQIFVGGMDGDIRALFSPKISKKGCLLCIARQTRFQHPEMMEYQREIIAPQAIPLFKEFQVRETTKLIIKKSEEPYRSTKPEMPLTGPGKGGKIAGASTVTQFMMRTLHEAPVLEDVRDSLLKLEKETRNNPKFVLQAYHDTQPKPIFDSSGPPQEENFILAMLKEVCKHCGMKICACRRKVVP